MKKICILSDLHLSSNPRVWKEAGTLAFNGFEVVILTVFTSKRLAALDESFLSNIKGVKYKSVLDLVSFTSSRIKVIKYKLARRIAVEAKKWLGIDSKHLLGYGAKALYEAGLNERADLYIAHVECGLYAGVKLAKKGKKVAFDFEDWYSRDYIVPERPIRLLEKLERTALQVGVYWTCPSYSMVTALQQVYSEVKPGNVLYNGFSIAENIIPLVKEKTHPSLVWFSQTIGPGRGLEILAKALKFVQTKVEVHLIGDISSSFEAQLREQFPSSHQLYIHSPVKHNELIPLLSKHTIGLAIERKVPASRNTTVTNKILQYVQAGLKVLATDTEGQKEIANFFPTNIAVVSADDSIKWAKAIEELIIATSKDDADIIKTFNDRFSWEAQEGKLIKLVSDSINNATQSN